MSPIRTEYIQRTVETVTLSERTNYQAQRAAAIDDITATQLVGPALHSEETQAEEVKEQESRTDSETVETPVWERMDTDETVDTSEIENGRAEEEAMRNLSKLIKLARSPETTHPPTPNILGVKIQEDAGKASFGSAAKDVKLETASENDDVFVEGLTPVLELPSNKTRAVSVVELDHSYGMSVSEDEPVSADREREIEMLLHQEEPSFKEEPEVPPVFKNERVESPIIDVENGAIDHLHLSFTPEIIRPEPAAFKALFPLRSFEEDDELVYEMLRCGLDYEDARYLKIGFERLLQVGSESVLDAHWGYHPDILLSLGCVSVYHFFFSPNVIETLNCLC